MSQERVILQDDEVDVLTELGQQLIYAILEKGTLGEIHELIDAGSPVWYQTEDEGMSPLHAAAYGEREDVVELLIAQGALWNAGENKWLDFY
jgi:protein arginine N-methyltransferase 2